MAILKLIHVFAVFIWIGGLLTLSRLLTYQTKENQQTQLQLKRILKRIYLAIDVPAMVLAVALGLTSLCLKEMDWKAPWLHMKLTFAGLLIICDMMVGWRIIRHKATLNKRDVTVSRVLHVLIALFFIGVLIAIYILKNPC